MDSATIEEVVAYIVNPWRLMALSFAISTPFILLMIMALAAGSEHARAGLAIMNGWLLWQGAGLGTMILLLTARMVLK